MTAAIPFGPRPGIKTRMYALGRLPKGRMNNTEKSYADALELRKQAGEVAWYRFEGIKLRLADSTFITIDFPVMLTSGILEMHEVKGFWTDDALAKTKIAAGMYPFVFKIVRKAKGGFWDITEVAA